MLEKGVVKGLGLVRNDEFSRQVTSGSHLARLVDKQDLGPSGTMIGQSSNLQPWHTRKYYLVTDIQRSYFLFIHQFIYRSTWMEMARLDLYRLTFQCPSDTSPPHDLGQVTKVLVGSFPPTKIELTYTHSLLLRRYRVSRPQARSI